MAVDTITITDGNGVSRTLVVDAIGADLVEVLKVAFGADDASPIFVSSANPLPVVDASVDTAMSAIGTTADASSALTAIGLLKAIKAAMQGTVAVDIQDSSVEVSNDVGNAVPVKEAAGTFGYAAGTAGTTVDVPAGARVTYVSVLSADNASITVQIGTGDVITVPALGVGFRGTIDVPVRGDTTLGSDVTIGGTPATWFVSWAA
jgi:hypothetical protein